MSRLRIVLIAPIMLAAVATGARADAARGGGLHATLVDGERALACLPAPAGDALPFVLSTDATRRTDPERLRALASRAAALVVVLHEEDAVDARTAESMDPWIADVEARAAAAIGPAPTWVIVPAERSGRDDDAEAFFLKRTALAIRAADPAASVLAASPRLRGSEPIAATVAPFLDGVATTGVREDGVAALALPANDALAAWSALVGSSEASVPLVTVRADATLLDRDCDGLRRVLETWRAALPADATPSSELAPVSFPPEVPVRSRLFVASDLSSRVVFEPEIGGPLPGAAMIVRLAETPIGPRLFDPLEGSKPVTAVKEGRRHAVQLPLVRRPLVLAWDRDQRPDEEQEDVQVAGVREPDVEEILANHFAQQAARDRRVENYVANVSTEMRYELGSSGQSFEIRVEGRYFHEKDGPREFENSKFYVNGASWDPKRGKIPELPLIQPEKVQVLPLELRLDRSYAYRLAGKAQRHGHSTWEVAFSPLAGDGGGLEGRAFIDAATWDLVEMNVTQVRLEPPVLSNQQSDRLGPVIAPDGEHWLVQRSDVHRVISLLGSSVGVTIRMTFSDFTVNAADFEAQRALARASDRQMLRDTDAGLVYLERNEAGERVPVTASSRKLFFILGARKDASYDGIVPLGGVNWLDHDLGGKGLQFNAFLAGAINSISISDPQLFKSRMTLSADAFLPFVKRSDRFRVPGAGVDEGEIVRARTPRVSVELSGPAGRHGRIAGTLGLRHEAWGPDDETDDDFKPPHDTLLVTLGLAGEVHARGIDARVSLVRGIRDGWEGWGRLDGLGQPPAGSNEPEAFWRWGAAISKTFSLTRLQTLDLEAQALGGQDLDRFTQYEFSAFGGERLPGFDGSGIHFDRAGIVRLSWGADVMGALGLDLEVGVARTWTENLPATVVAEHGTSSDHVGVALVGSLPGPWGTLLRFDVGAPIYSSDYEDVEGDIVAQFLVLKLLK